MIAEHAARRIKVAVGETDRERWSEPSNLLRSWEGRSVRAVDFIPAGARVLDLGCGAMTLERHLPYGCTYLPADLVPRDSRTLICELNKGILPRVDPLPDVVTLLGVAEYVNDLPALFRALRGYDARLVVTYNATDYAAGLDRAALGWVNAYSVQALIALAKETGWRLRLATWIDRNQVLVLLVPPPAPQPPTAVPRDGARVRPRRVAVLSCYDVGNFGDRLGYHVLSPLLPSHAEVVWISHNRCAAEMAADPFDLLVLGIGNSLYQTLFTSGFFRFVEAVPQVIGIFGTQYREVLATANMSRLLDKVDRWFARYEEDALIYGRGRTNVEHLGDWLFAACPMARGTEERPLRIEREIRRPLPVDRVMQNIQRYRAVHSARLHPLVVALTSAERVAYREQRVYPNEPRLSSGKFRSMLIDVLGRTFPENELFAVDHGAVTRYRAAVRNGMRRLEADLARRLSETPGA